MAQLMSFPLLKYSYANSNPGETTNFSWIHTVGHLIVVFDSFRGPHSSLLMKVTQGAALLEQVDLQGKVNEASEIIAAMSASGSEIRLEHLPISALVRCPLLALRYTRPDGMVRRIQMKFAADSEYQQAYDLLTQIGCYMSSSGSFQAQQHSDINHREPAPLAIHDRNVQPPVRQSLPPQRHSELDPREPAPLALDHRDVQTARPRPAYVAESQSSLGPSQSEYFPSQPQIQRTTTLPARDSGYTQNDISEYVRNGGTASAFFDQSSSNSQFQSTYAGIWRPGSGPSVLPNRMGTPQLGTIDEHEEARPITAPSLSAYAAQPYETRRRDLDQFVADSLNDDDFITLCEDVGACWRRFALGLR
ncbi:hypothetical protein K490DRAFT_32910 [Saccharata proteae CBS 121410]|uniref:Uncharacterized protein n=1 Tax=Saccharata proteae CBS 121410 TaxID=1314787 RepID=A0A9P4HY26_9PEZI|nr:hypothetical protein K490DRAFT_32910 [Saccharata proteae CBS 121410]